MSMLVIWLQMLSEWDLSRMQAPKIKNEELRL